MPRASHSPRPTAGQRPAFPLKSRAKARFGALGKRNLAKTTSIPTRNQHLSALRHFFDGMVTRHAIVLNPALSVRGERYTAVEGKTPEISIDQARQLLTSLDTSHVIGLRDRALLAILVYTSSRAGAVAKLKRGNFYHAGQQWMLHFSEKGGKSREIPVRGDLQELISAYIDAAGLRDAPKDAPLFQSALKKQRRLSGKTIHVNDICRMMKRRLKDIGLPLLYSPIPSASPPSPTCWSRASRSKTCSAWPGTPIRAPPASTTGASARSRGILWRGFPCDALGRRQRLHHPPVRPAQEQPGGQPSDSRSIRLFLFSAARAPARISVRGNFTHFRRPFSGPAEKNAFRPRLGERIEIDDGEFVMYHVRRYARETLLFLPSRCRN
jgi:hypothetical protein